MKNLEFRFPTIEESIDINNTYREMFNSCDEKGVVTEEQMMFYLEKNKIFTREMQNKLSNLEEGPLFKYPIIEILQEEKNTDGVNNYLEAKLLEIISGKRRICKDSLFRNEDKILNKEYNEYKKLSQIKDIYTRYTREGLAINAKREKIVYYCTYNGDTGEKYWKNYKEYVNTQNDLVYTLISNKCIEFTGGLSVTTLRRLARHPIWRTRWISATKTGQSLFSGNITEWDINKTYLCYWSNFYDSIYEMYEGPEDFIINKDEVLDNFLEARRLESKNGTSSSSQENGDKIIFKPRMNPVKRK